MAVFHILIFPCLVVKDLFRSSNGALAHFYQRILIYCFSKELMNAAHFLISGGCSLGKKSLFSAQAMTGKALAKSVGWLFPLWLEHKMYYRQDADVHGWATDYNSAYFMLNSLLAKRWQGR